LANFVPREQEGFPVKNSAGDQEESFYGVVASSLKAVVGLDVSLEKLQVVDRMQSFLKMKPELVSSDDDFQGWSSCRLA